MNTRVQVEHCVTELVTGIDIVREQVKIAAGEPLAYGQDDVCCAGTRSSAASTPRTPPRTSPRAGPDRALRSRRAVRCATSGAEAGYEVLPLYDPMIGKLIVWDVDREASTRGMLRALGSSRSAAQTLIPFHKALARDRPVAERRDLPRPGRGQGVAQAARVPGRRAGGR